MITQKPKIAMTVNISPELCSLVDTVRCQYGFTRHGLLVQCLNIALPILAAEAQQAGTPLKSAK